MKNFKLSIFCSLLCLVSSCSTLNSLFEKEPEAQAGEQPRSYGTRFSEANQMPTGVDRNYKRMTRSKMEEESELQSNAGSLWVMEGQQSYLFAQNKTRREGDIVNLKIEGAAMKQIETKVSIIRRLQKELEEEERRAQELAAGRLADNSSTAGDRNPASTTGTPAAGSNSTAVNTKPTADSSKETAKEEKQDLSDVQLVQSRIIEKMPDGNYKIKGAQPFMIGKKEYKVIVSGVIRPEDYNDEGMSSGKLLDPQYDVVSIRRKAKDDKASVL